MLKKNVATQRWFENLLVFTDRRAITMLFLGFSAGLPYFLIFATLSLWLREAGVERSAVTFFSWAALGYSFKFMWAPLADRLPLPVFALLGRRRSWLLFSQFMIAGAICWMAFIDPSKGEASLTQMACAAVLLGFSSATQDIVVDAFRIELADVEMQATLSATYVAGYRLGMLTSGAGALYLASYFGTSTETYNYQAWKSTYCIMAGFMSIGVFTTLLQKEPVGNDKQSKHRTTDYVQFFCLFLLIVGCFIGTFVLVGDVAASLRLAINDVLSNEGASGFIVGMLRLGLAIGVCGTVAYVVGRLKLVNTALVVQGYVDPIRQFFERFGVRLAVFLIVLVGLYRVSDIVLSVVANMFYQDLGFTKPEIASIVKTWGLCMTLLGGFVGGLMTNRFGMYTMLLWGAILASITNLLFLILANVGHDVFWLYVVIAADNLAAGLASVAFVAFLSSLTDVSFTAVQYAIFSSVMSLLPKVIGGFSGSIIEVIDYSGFFLTTTLMGVPVIYLSWKAKYIFVDN